MVKAQYKCLRCRFRYESGPGPTQCPKCGHLYVKWLNYNDVDWNKEESKGNKMGSRKVYGIEDQEQFLEVLQKQLGVVGKALTSLKINRVVFVTWMESPAFKEAVECIQGGVIDNIEHFTLENATTNLNMAKFILSNHPVARKRGYGKIQHIKGKVKMSFADMVQEADEEEE